MMTKLEKVLTAIRQLPQERQDEIADEFAAYAAMEPDAVNRMVSESHHAEIARRFAKPFEPADEADIAAFFRKHAA